MLRTGAPWRDVPERYGAWSTVASRFYRWRKAYGGMTVSEAHRLKELERENARLKRLLAERDLALDALEEYLQKK